MKIKDRHFDEMKKITANVLKELGIVESLIEQQMRVFDTRRADIVEKGK